MIISLLIKKFDFHFINCEIEIEFDKNFTAKIEINYHHNTNTDFVKSYLLYYIDSCKSGGYKFSNINHVIINTISCMCNMTYEHYINQPMQATEIKLNMIIAIRPQLINSINRSHNHVLIKKFLIYHLITNKCM